jgi:3-isopropylmalate/(R)-2-methylmalate dehydratase large subunit
LLALCSSVGEWVLGSQIKWVVALNTWSPFNGFAFMSLSAGKTLFEKIWATHLVAEAAGKQAIIAVDRLFLHERTGASALNNLAAMGRQVKDPARVFAIMDHIVDTRFGRGDQTLVKGGQAFITQTRDAAQKQGIQLIDVNDPEQGIVHVVSPELGLVLPGLTVAAPDSHTCTQGAFGALAWGIGSTEAEHVMATGTSRMKKPATMRVNFEGELPAGVTAKDMALALISMHGSDGGSGHVVEFAGPAVRALDMEARMTLCNMATEFAAVSCLIAPDEKTFEYLAGRRYAPQSFKEEYWRDLVSDADAQFDREIVLDASTIVPMVSWGTSPQQSAPVGGTVPDASDPAIGQALEYTEFQAGQKLQGAKIDAAFIGSCTNSRISDLRRAAAILKGRQISPAIKKAMVVPGSNAVRQQAEAEGLDAIFKAAGFEWRMSGCSLCFFAGGESFPEGSRTISSTNRNFVGRQGPGIKTHIASPETVAASALAGAIADPRDYTPERLEGNA